MAISTLAMQLAALAAMKATGQPFNNATLITFSNPVAAVKTVAISDLVESDYDGYAAMAGLLFGVPYIDAGNNALMEAPSVEFVCTGLTLIESVYGWAVVNAGLTALWMLEVYQNPIPMNVIGRGLIVIPRYQYGQ